MCAEIRQFMFEYTIYHSHQYYLDNYSGNVANKINQLAEKTKLIIENILSMIIPIFLMVIISMIMLFFSSPWFSLFLAVWLVIHLIITYLFSAKTQELSQNHAIELNKLNGKLIDILSNINMMRIFARERHEALYYKNNQHQEVQAHLKATIYGAILSLILGINTTIYIILTVLGSIVAWQKGYIEIGDVILINGSLYIVGLIWHCSRYLVIIQGWIGNCKESLAILNQPHQITDDLAAKTLTVNLGRIEFKNVTFSYKHNKNLFEKRNILIEGGSKVGLVGFSGSGKTTFINLILRLFEISSGQILIDGQDIKKVSQESLRENISYIPQDPNLYHRSIKENIAYGKLEASLEEIIQAADNAKAQQFIEGLPAKYHTLAGERGSKLSGGQRQRIAIARAIIKNTKIMIFDEATSALDSVTEQAIQQNLIDLANHKTLLVIAHRLSTLLSMDRILVFHNGDIIEDGTHEELIKIKGHYYKLWQMQSGGFLPG